MDEVGWTFTPEKFPILGPVWASITTELADGAWHPLGSVVATAVAGGANAKTARNLIRSGRRAGRIAQTGGYSSKTRADSRMVRLVEGSA